MNKNVHTRVSLGRFYEQKRTHTRVSLGRFYERKLTHTCQFRPFL
jgi:hypothetical protein